jgi:diguanylate cyclase (GGDEF)-like protein
METAPVTDNDAVRVLLVEDDEDDYLLTRDLLSEGYGVRFSVVWARTWKDGLFQLTERRHDVALLDHNLGGQTGIELLRTASARGCRVPVIMLTGQADRETDLQAMHAGAADYLVKGRVTGDILERTIRYARERHRLLDEIRSLSLIDSLTGLSNRRAFFTLADQRLQLLERRSAQCLLLFADVDGLKRVNDELGHEAGDRLLLEAARVLRATFRRTDLVARLGGDEFVVLADEASDDDVVLILERLERNVEERNAGSGEGFRLSISAGAVCFKASPSVRLQELVAEADERMLRCKQGRRRSREQASDTADRAPATESAAGPR